MTELNFFRWSPVEVPWKFLDDEGEELPDLLVSGCVDARPCSIFMFGRRMTRTRTWSKSALIVHAVNLLGYPLLLGIEAYHTSHWMK